MILSAEKRFTRGTEKLLNIKKKLINTPTHWKHIYKMKR